MGVALALKWILGKTNALTQWWTFHLNFFWIVMLLLHALQPRAERSDCARPEIFTKSAISDLVCVLEPAVDLVNVCPIPNTVHRAHVLCKLDYIWRISNLTSHFLFPVSLLPCNFWINVSVFWEGCRFGYFCSRLWYLNFKRSQTQSFGLFWRLILNSPF